MSMSTDLDVEIDLEAMLDASVACDFEDCSTEATYGARIKPSTCSHVLVGTLCDGHERYVRHHLNSAVLWRCSECGHIAPAGVFTSWRL